MGQHLPVLPIAVSLLAAAFLSAAGDALGRRLSDLLAIATAAFSLVDCWLLLRQSLATPVVYWFGNWMPRKMVSLGIGFVVDPFGAGLGVLISLLTLAALVFSWHYFDAAENHFQPLMLVFMGAMCGFSFTGDLFNLFVFFELMGAAAFALCGLKTEEPAPLQGAFNFAVTNTVGAFITLTGLAYVYARTGALNMAQIGHSFSQHTDPLITISFLFLATGFLVKSATVPFHFWLPDAHAVAPTPVCILFSGVMVELGIYAVARIYWTMFQTPLAPHTRELRAILVGAGALTAVVGGLMCFAQHHLKRMLAFSTVSHAGLMLVAIGLLNPRALAGFAIYLVSHGLFKAGLFLCAGILLHRLQSVSERKLFGRARRLKFTAVLFVLGALGLAGLPPFGTAAGVQKIEAGGEMLRYGWISWLSLFAGILTAGAVLRATARIFWGWGDLPPSDESAQRDEQPETREAHGRVAAFLFIPAAGLIFLGMAAGLLPQFSQRAEIASLQFQNQGEYINHVLENAPTTTPVPAPGPNHAGPVLRGIASAISAVLLALLSIYWRRVPALLRFAHRLELGNRTLKDFHSGHPGDYVAWLTFGVATAGALFAGLLR